MHLPFSDAQFFDLFAAFNRSFWPVLAALWVASLWLAVGLARARVNRTALILLVSFHWMWSGLVFQEWSFARINPAAHLFAALFVVEGVLFVWAALRGQLIFNWDASLRAVAGLAYLAASLAYPLLVLADGHRLPAAPAFGVPCPTTLFTIGVLLCSTATVPRVLLVVPIVWSVIAVGAALSIGITPDLLLLAGAASVAPLLLPIAVQQRLARWWTRDADAARPMRGDAFSAHPDFEMTLAHTTAARPEDVWPWLLQLGYRRGGLYSYDWLDRLFGYLDRPSATTLLPEFQRLHEGDVIPLGHGPGFPVKTVEANRTLVLGDAQPAATWSWEIALEPVGPRSDPHHLAEQGRGAAHGGRTRVHCAAGTGRVPDDAAHAARAGGTGRVAVPARGCAPPPRGIDVAVFRWTRPSSPRLEPHEPVHLHDERTIAQGV